MMFEASVVGSGGDIGLRACCPHSFLDPELSLIFSALLVADPRSATNAAPNDPKLVLHFIYQHLLMPISLTIPLAPRTAVPARLLTGCSSGVEALKRPPAGVSVFATMQADRSKSSCTMTILSLVSVTHRPFRPARYRHVSAHCNIISSGTRFGVAVATGKAPKHSISSENPWTFRGRRRYPDHLRPSRGTVSRLAY